MNHNTLFDVFSSVSLPPDSLVSMLKLRIQKYEQERTPENLKDIYAGCKLVIIKGIMKDNPSKFPQVKDILTNIAELEQE